MTFTRRSLFGILGGAVALKANPKTQFKTEDVMALRDALVSHNRKSAELPGTTWSRQLEAMLLGTQLPEGIRWYDVNGQITFPIYGASGGPMNQVGAVLVAKLPEGFDGDFGMFGSNGGMHHMEKGRNVYTLAFWGLMPLAQAQAKVERAVTVLRLSGGNWKP